MPPIKRRALLGLVTGIFASPAAAYAQSRSPVLGVLGSASEAQYTRTIAMVRRGLNEAGFVENRNLTVVYRWAEFQYDRLPALAAELVSHPVDAIYVTGSVVSALAAKSATSAIPIIFANGSDPVQYKLVASLSRPGGNVTGMTFMNAQLGPKRLQLLRLLNPRTAVVAVLVNPRNPNAADAKMFQTAGRSIGLDVPIVEASSESELEPAFNRAIEARADALLVHVDALFNDRGEFRIAELASKHRLPAMTANVTYTSRGGLISYGADTGDLNRQAGLYVARALRGEKPADLPVVQPTSFSLRINLRTAKALGLTIPESFLLLADEVLE